MKILDDLISSLNNNRDVIVSRPKSSAMYFGNLNSMKLPAYFF